MAKKHIGRIEVVYDNPELMDCVCICPHCGRHVTYGQITMYNGNHGCPACHMELRAEVEHDRQHNYNTYVHKANAHEYEPFRYKED